MDIEALLARAVAVRTARGLSVEVMLRAESGDRQSYIRHCKDAADRDAYIARCEARGESYRVLA